MKLETVEGDPFAASARSGLPDASRLEAIDYDPFAEPAAEEAAPSFANQLGPALKLGTANTIRGLGSGMQAQGLSLREAIDAPTRRVLTELIARDPKLALEELIDDAPLAEGTSVNVSAEPTPVNAKAANRRVDARRKEWVDERLNENRQRQRDEGILDLKIPRPDAVLSDAGKAVEDLGQTLVEDNPEWQRPEDLQKSWTELLADPQTRGAYLARALGENAPALVGGIGAASVGGVTAGPSGAIAGAALFTQTLETGYSFEELKKLAGSDEEAAETAMQVGAFNAVLESTPIGRLLSKSPLLRKRVLKATTEALGEDKFLRRAMREGWKQAAAEGSTEALQEVIGNVGKQVYDKNQNLLEGVGESAFVGSLLGTGAGVVGQVGSIKNDPAARAEDDSEDTPIPPAERASAQATVDASEATQASTTSIQGEAPRGRTEPVDYDPFSAAGAAGPVVAQASSGESTVSAPASGVAALTIEDFKNTGGEVKSVIVKDQDGTYGDRIKRATGQRPLWNKTHQGYIFPKRRESEVRTALGDLLGAAPAPGPAKIIDDGVTPQALGTAPGAPTGGQERLRGLQYKQKFGGLDEGERELLASLEREPDEARGDQPTSLFDLASGKATAAKTTATPNAGPTVEIGMPQVVNNGASPSLGSAAVVPVDGLQGEQVPSEQAPPLTPAEGVASAAEVGTRASVPLQDIKAMRLTPLQEPQATATPNTAPAPIPAGPDTTPAIPAAPPASIDAQANRAATSPANALPEPTQAQQAAGNYKKGKVRLHGLDISIENPAGATRAGVDPQGKPWSAPVAHHYGYIRRTEGKDGDQVDVYLGPGAENPELPVFVVDQVNPKTRRFDEHKVMLGFPTLDAAISGYLENYPRSWRGLSNVRRVSPKQFKTWLREGDTSKRFASPPGEALRARIDKARTRLNLERSRAGVADMLPEAIRRWGGSPRVLVRSDATVAPKPGDTKPQREPDRGDTLPEDGKVKAMNPGANYTGMLDDRTLASTAKRDTPLRREDVLIPFLKALGASLYQGRVKGKGVLGFYLPKKEAVRIKKKSDLEVAAHEIAHLLDDRIPEIRKSWLKDKTMAGELKGVSYDQSKTYEGFAEFVRLWMTQPQKAQAAAPNFTRWWEAFTERHEYGPAIRRARDGMQTWYTQDAVSRAASKIGPAPEINAALSTRGAEFRQAVADDLHGIYALERSLTGGIAPVGPYETARLTRAAYSIVDGALTEGAPVVNPDGSHGFRGKGLQQILEPVADRLEDFLQYAVGRSADELKTQGRENLFTRSEIDAMLAKKQPGFAQAFLQYQMWNKAIVDFAQAKGLINPETRALWKRTQYLPFYRVGQSASTQRKDGVEGNWQGIKRLTGGTGNLRDILGNMIENASHLITESLRNEARVKVADMADLIQGGGRFMVKIGKDTKPITVDKAQLERAVYEMLGLNPGAVRAGNVPDELVETIATLEAALAAQPGFMQFRMHGQAPTGDNVIAVLRDGKPDFYEVADPILYRAFQSLNRPGKHWLIRFLNGFRRVGQSSITLSLDFMAANLARDTLMGSIISRHGFKPFVDSIRGMKSRLTKDEAYREFIANGGGLASYMVDDDAFRTHLKRFYTKQGINYKTVLNAAPKLLHFVENLTDAFEMSTRLGEYKLARQAGAHPRHAAYSAREVSTDFAMRGDSQVLGFFYDSVMFLKAGVNSIDREYRGIKHDPNAIKIAAGTGAVALASMALFALNRDNPLYDELEDWDKDLHWHSFVPDGEGGYQHFRYPKPWTVGGIASIAERSLGQVLAESQQAGGTFGRDVVRIVTDLFQLSFMPQILAPLYEQATNKTGISGRPIETLSMQNLQPFARANVYTSRTMTDVGLATRDLPRSLQVSPARAEALLQGYFNTWALYGLSLSDAALYDDKPDLRVDEYPVFRRFYQTQPHKHTKYETMFYDMLREATELRQTMRHMDSVNRPDVAGELEVDPAIERYNQVTRANDELTGIRNEMQAAYRDATLTPKEKRAALDKLTGEKNALLQAVVEDIEAQDALATDGARDGA